MTTREIPADVPSFVDYTELIQWCMDVRYGKIKVSPEARQYAKVMSHLEVYGVGVHHLGDKT